MVRKVSAVKIFNLYKNKKFIKKIDPGKLTAFLNDVLKGEINIIEEATEVFLNDINEDYNAILNAGNKREKSNATNVKNYINDTIDSFGPNSILKQVSESEKRDIATGEEDIGDAPPLETEEEKAEKRQKLTTGKGLKIMTPKQMTTRLPVLFGQIKAGNNSGKSKNVIRQIVYSLYRSKDLTKTVYNYLINNI